MSSTPANTNLSTTSSEKGNELITENQPPPSLAMSTNPIGPEKRAVTAKRLRGGWCDVRHSSAVPIPNTYIFFRMVSVVLAAAASVLRIVVACQTEKSTVTDATCNDSDIEAQRFVLFHNLKIPATVTYMYSKTSHIPFSC